MAQWKEGGWSRAEAPGCSLAQVGTGAGEQFFSFGILGHHSYLETNKESWNPQIPGRERRGVIPWFHLFPGYANPPGCAGAQWHELCVPSDVPSCAHSSLCAWWNWESRAAFRGIYHSWVNKCTAAVVCWAPAGKFLWRWSFPAPCELPNAFHCFLQLQGSAGSLFLLQLRVGSTRKEQPLFCPGPSGTLGLPWRSSCGPGTLRAESRGIVMCCAQHCGRTGTSASCGIAPWHRPGCAMGLMQLRDRSVDFTHIEKDSDFDLNPSVI